MLGFLPDPIRAFSLAAIALLGGFLFLKAVDLPYIDRRRLCWTWLTLTIAAFFSVHFLIYAVIVGIACALLLRTGSDLVPAFYIALLPVMPLYRYTIPGALGIQNLFDLDHQRVLALTLLLPALLASRSEATPKKPAVRSWVDAFFLLYCAWLFMLAFIQRPTFTDSLRSAFEVLMFLLVPYLAVSRLVRTWNQLLAAISALVFSGILVAAIGILEQRMTWRFYQFIPDLLQMNKVEAFAGQFEMRFGMLRIRSSIDGGLGLFMVIATGALLCLRQGLMISGWRFWTVLAAFAMTLAFTVSRGSWIACSVMLAAFLLFHLIKSPTRFVVIAGLCLFALPIAQDYFLSAKDAFGTFDYRAALYKAGVPMVWERPIFGWDSMQELFATGRLEHLRQGQGIIDLVNTYLGEALLRGIPGLILFSGVQICSVLAVLRRHQRPDISEEAIQTAVPAFLVSTVLATAFLLVTTSLVGHTPTYLWLLAALCSSYAALDSTKASDSLVPREATTPAPRRSIRRPTSPRRKAH
jgi:O-antigen ligase